MSQDTENKRFRKNVTGQKSPVTFSMSQMSLSDQAMASVIAEIRGERDGLLGYVRPVHCGLPGPAVEARAAGMAWSVLHVADRLKEAFETLYRLPMALLPKSFGSAMPAYVYDRGDLNSQMETRELDRTLSDRNRVRLTASAAEIARMEQALFWPMEFLGDAPAEARAVLMFAAWEARGVSPARAAARAKLDLAAAGRERMAGLATISASLIKRRVPVT